MKRENGITRIQLLIIVLLILTIILVGGNLCYQIVNKKRETSDKNEVLLNISDEGTNNQTNNQPNTVSQRETTRNKVVIDGFKITIPEEYNYWIDDKGLMIADENLSWKIRYVVREDSYESKMQNPEELMSGVVNKGLNITEPIKEIEINSKKYAYFTYEENNEKLLVAYTSANNEKRFGINASGSGEDYASNLLNIFDQIASTAVETDEPNTTTEEAIESNMELPGTAEEFGSLTLKGVTAKYSVPVTFYSTDKVEEDYFTYEGFTTADSKISASYSLVDFLGYDNVEEYLYSVANSKAINENENFQISEIQTFNNVKYITVQYTHNNYPWKLLFAACELSNGYVLKFDAQTLYENKQLTIDTVKDFFYITEE